MQRTTCTLNWSALGITLALALGALLILVSLTREETALSAVYAQTGTAAPAAPAIPDAELHVCTSGCDFPSVQAAVDAAMPGDIIKVVGGVYTDVRARAGITQVVYISKSVIIQGGYTISDWATSDPMTNSTILDAQGQGRVLYITGDITPTIEGLHITGGNATGLGGDPGDEDAGGGVYVITATATISGNEVFGNTARWGGGIYLRSSSTSIRGNTVLSNTSHEGGGIALDYSPGILNWNTIISNTANSSGGGLFLYYSAATLGENVFAFNAATNYGGGLYLSGSDADLVNNVVTDNRANNAGSGIYVSSSKPRLWHTTIARNIGGDNSGVYAVIFKGDLAMTNTILANQGVGITVVDGTAILNGILWYSNGVNTVGLGTVIVTQAYTGNPAFAADGYHLTAGSMAIDRGVDAGITTDIDGEPRDATPDLGADEYRSASGESRTIVDPDLGGLLIFTDTRGLTTTVQFPPGAVTDTTEIVYTAVPSPTEPVSPGLRSAGQAFDLDAYRNGERLFSFTFSNTVTVTIHYADADVAGIFEDTLKLYRWVTTGWQVVGTRLGEGQTLDMDNNVLTAWLRGLTRFRNMGVSRYDIYLPLVIRNG